MKIRILLALASLALSGCTIAETATVYKARTELIGTNIVDLISCAGLPAKPPLLVEPDEMIVEWEETIAANAGTTTFTMQLPFGMTAKLGTPSGQCHFDALVFRDGLVANVGFNGPALADNASVCSGLVSECLMHPNQTELPKGFDAIKQLMPSTASTPIPELKKAH